MNCYEKILFFDYCINKMPTIYRDAEQIESYQNIIEIGFISNMRNRKLKKKFSSEYFKFARINFSIIE